MMELNDPISRYIKLICVLFGVVVWLYCYVQIFPVAQPHLDNLIGMGNFYIYDLFIYLLPAIVPIVGVIQMVRS